MAWITPAGVGRLGIPSTKANRSSKRTAGPRAPKGAPQAGWKQSITGAQRLYFTEQPYGRVSLGETVSPFLSCVSVLTT